MSFIISVYTHEGIVMAADSRLTLNAKVQQGATQKEISFDFSNSTRKLFCTKKGVGISTCGDAGIGSTPIAGYIEQFGSDNQEEDVDGLASKLLGYFKDLNPGLKTTFHVAGYSEKGTQKLYLVSTADNISRQVNPDGLQGAQWAGEVDILTRIINASWLSDDKGNPGQKLPFYPIPWEFFSLQDAIDFAIFGMSATIGAIRFQNRIKTVGGPIDILVIKPAGASWVQQKELHGEILI
ncbi:MAG TPA: hypothetical protein VLK23_14820 [Thermodesulfobacteriota bacterium]|nr:hypothetical protein [Thermodesulfobacteriota bacterium]